MRDMKPGPPRDDQPPWRWIGMHAAGAGAFFFTLHYLAMRSSLETSLLWAGVTAVCAACLAYAQTRRR